MLKMTVRIVELDLYIFGTLCSISLLPMEYGLFICFDEAQVFELASLFLVLLSCTCTDVHLFPCIVHPQFMVWPLWAFWFWLKCWNVSKDETMIHFRWYRSHGSLHPYCLYLFLNRKFSFQFYSICASAVYVSTDWCFLWAMQQACTLVSYSCQTEPAISILRLHLNVASFLIISLWSCVSLCIWNCSTCLFIRWGWCSSKAGSLS